MGVRARQGGWAGLIGLLIALLLVFVLARTVMKQMGLVGGSSQTATAAAAASNPVDATTPAPMQAVERARALEAQVREQALEQQKRIDASTQ